MKFLYLSILFFLTSVFSLSGQEFVVNEIATLKQVYGETFESEELLPFNDLNIEFGYVLYQANINTTSENAELILENVRDFAAVYVDDKLQGVVTDDNKQLRLTLESGEHNLQLYVENIGRITYGPEILDNTKGLFGEVYLDDEQIENWTITVLDVKDYNIEDLKFEVGDKASVPSFYRGMFDIAVAEDSYLDISGWGMGEVWINGNYMGSYWENEKQQSIQVSKEYLKKGQNQVVIFDLKNNDHNTLKLVDNPVFK